MVFKSFAHVSPLLWNDLDRLGTERKEVFSRNVTKCCFRASGPFSRTVEARRKTQGKFFNSFLLPTMSELLMLIRSSIL